MCVWVFGALSVGIVAEETGVCRTDLAETVVGVCPYTSTTKTVVGVRRQTVGVCAVRCCDAQAEVGVGGATRCSGSGVRVVSQTLAAFMPETSRWVA